MNKNILTLLLFFIPLAHAQDGYLRFAATERWNITLNDSLTVLSDSCIALPAGKYTLAAHPVNDTHWPGILVRDSLSVSQGDTLTFHLNREKEIVKVTKPGAMPLRINTKFFRTSDQAPVFSMNLKRGLLVGAIAANWLSFYLKRRADSYYSRYQSVNNLSQIRNNYHRSQQFDNLSSAFLGLSVAALGTYIYLIVNE